ncbi:MAG: hypothetical protein HY703_10515 [Gemmatimonadetes bacterium]|nr:hypothetical protein [Gemmatimonadota bacterium]
MSAEISELCGHYAIVLLRDIGPLKVFGLASPCCIARVVAADEVGLWIEHPSWGRGYLPAPRVAHVLIRWENLESLAAFPGLALDDLELSCIIDARDELHAHPVGFQAAANAQ